MEVNSFYHSATVIKLNLVVVLLYVYTREVTRAPPADANARLFAALIEVMPNVTVFKTINKGQGHLGVKVG